jgi:hypothetical protein
MSRAWRGGSTRAYRRTREIVLLENALEHGGACQIALPGQWDARNGEVRCCTGVADCVHHPYGKAAGDDRRELVPACTPCNLKIGDPTRKRSYDPPGRSATRW